ncbi:transglycosylase SLT domain-containing protein [Massilia sp. CCM 9210]|uniref:lytic transglycosylase domain-containing protein n=1 Tax=Massilia scottii TaxID=3057166 RepID=UPI002796D0B6|nr:lytic transglycosylase domain-containing protein [Massilia sp. CCM 9210]MDQ1814805.1 transglycosylase SLT domain-containing protein [Massilia sp. CCM 9210]
MESRILMYLPKLFAVAIVAGACLIPAYAQAPVPPYDPRADDDTFLLLREAARQDDAAKANAYASRLQNYPIPSYVDYYRLKTRMRVASSDEFRDFLTRYQGLAIADRLRNDWLLELGRARDWANFDQQLPLFVLNDDTQVKCYALMSRVARGEKVADDARALLTNPPGYGEACGALISTLAQSGQFDASDLLAQLRLAGEFKATGPARRIAALLGVSELHASQAVDLPALAMARGIGDTRADHEVYLMAVSRMARTTQKLAVVALEKNAPRLSPQEQAIGWAGIAHAASLTLAPEAYDYWRKSAGAPLTAEQIQWKTRIALRRADWKTVKATIESMPAPLRAQPGWTYWLGRALQAEHGAHDAAVALYQRIADQNSFYGQLALEELGQLISIPPPGPALTPEEMAPMASNPGLRRALKFFSLRLRPEGTREWNWELRKFSERELLAAAEFARMNQILDRMVNTSDRTRTQFDYTQRFPSPHNDILHPTAQQLGLDRAWVYGLIRQESRFIMDARSSVGASGLMQVMPATGAYVARKIGLGDYVKNKLTDVRTNILLGANYMSMVLANADGSQTLATAAYNAGPGRMRNWRGKLDEPMEGAIFAESIPYMETRIYVKNVMSNATNYAALFENKPQSLKARLGKITPRSAQGNDLP